MTVPLALAFIFMVALTVNAEADDSSQVGATELSTSADRVAQAMADGQLSLHGYKKDLAIEGLLRWGQATGREDLVRQAQRTAADSGLTAGSVDNFQRGPFNCLVFWLWKSSDDSKWLPGFVEQTLQYADEVSRSPEGAIEHPRGQKRGGGQAMLIDALQDYASRMAMLGQVTGDEQHFSEAVRQYRIYRKILRDPDTGLWSQGRGWLEDRSTLSPGAWSRGHGWLIRGMVDTLLLLPPESEEMKEMMGYLRELADALLKVQQPDGMWHCLLHRPAADSPPETSGTALIAGNIAIAVASGFLDREPYAEAATRAFAALPAYVERDGVIQSVSPGPGPLSNVEPWAVEQFPPGDEHGPFAIIFAALGEAMLSQTIRPVD